MTSVMKVGNAGFVLFPHFLRRNHRKILPRPFCVSCLENRGLRGRAENLQGFRGEHGEDGKMQLEV